MADDAICLQPATALAAAVREREISSRELLQLFLQRVERLNPGLNAIVTLDSERAFEAAAAADRKTTSGEELGPLHGLPITIKDAIEVGGMRSTGGSPALADHVPASDAPAVARVRQAGAYVFGKTNVPEWSGDIQTYNSLFGTTNNPWAPDRTCGGSSGGPAVSVSTGMTSFEIGTDIGGSVRIPSSFCGTCGHKPSFGIVSQRGYLDSPRGGIVNADINVFGPMARSVADLELLMSVLAHPNTEDEVAWRISLPPARWPSLSGYRVGLWLDDPSCEVEAAAVTLMSEAAAALEQAGAKVSDSRPPLSLPDVRALFEGLVMPAVSVSFEGQTAEAIAGNHRRWLDLNREREGVRAVWAEWFRDHDVLLCPVMAMLPFRHDHVGTFADRTVLINGKVRPQADSMSWTGLVGVSYLPSTVVPVGRADGVPVGVQVVGPYLEDRTSLFVAARLAELTGGYVPPPVAS